MFLPLPGGHRGSGCTDSRHARRFAGMKPPENTLDSIRKAFADGTEWVEIDAVLTGDHVAVVTHSSHLPDHVFHPVPSPFIGDLSAAEVKDLRVGPRKNGIIPTLAEVLALVAVLPAPASGGFRLNIELKDVKGTGRAHGGFALVETVARAVQDGPLPLDRIIFSSFATSDLVHLHQVLPQARLAQLFDIPSARQSAVYPDTEDRYFHFTPANLDKVCAQVPLAFVHPEARSVTPGLANHVLDRGMGLNAWTWREVPPTRDPGTVEHMLACSRMVQRPLGFLTDFVPEVRAWLSSHNRPSMSSIDAE